MASNPWEVVSEDPTGHGLKPPPVQNQPAQGLGLHAAQHQSVLGKAIQQYPILGKLNLKGVSSPGAQDYMLEFWQANDPGTAQEPRPAGIPKGDIGVQIFDPKTTPLDILADVTSHYLRFHDPQVKTLYQQFEHSITPAQQKRLRADYAYAKAHEGVQRPFDDWVKNVRLPAYFRGYTFKQWPDSFTSKVFTPAQINLFNQVRSYVGMK